MKKIKLVGYLGDKNLGDQILADSAEFLINENILSEQVTVERYDFSHIGKLSFLERVGKRIGVKYSFGKILEKEISKFDLKTFESIDAIVFAGGGMIKYKHQNCWLHVSLIISAAIKLKIPVYLHAVGVEGYDEKDERCQLLSKYLNSEVVKKISTRDDLETLRERYIKENIKTERVADSAVLSSSVYNISKKKSNVIGLGLVRGDIFKDHGIPFSRNDVVDLYSSLLKELESQGIEYQLFTNGLSFDSELIADISSKTGLNLQVIEPSSPEQLMEVISNFKGVIAARLHACIVSYSLDIPVVGLVWNNKLRMFGQHIGYSDRFLSNEDFNSNEIIKLLNSSINEGYDQARRQDYLKSVRCSMASTVAEIMGEE
ncbi:polysaccharide pyruvyl transferase family protein [Vibrio alginolyticus]|uniref:polysaccharide pyruvyl transferase family protein n=1 Tax=Vibrio alginolyticus TaxID=663 RepID=UPI00215CC0AD|nr:polysaccharide pyruvyl transferase family protein [Vibrio alginolyticus]EKL9828091.1 polysaccharide pyruvyl transferase family protein [Vibrio alginolyticus]ELE6589755.1 polysaccharide pyruvyl transferase family protein [Vibrio alginolyticus]MCR9904890.1 polysaccharide pyruvyl transferase family protein [Vibrio alginolyticus]